MIEGRGRIPQGAVRPRDLSHSPRTPALIESRRPVCAPFLHYTIKQRMLAQHPFCCQDWWYCSWCRRGPAGSLCTWQGPSWTCQPASLPCSQVGRTRRGSARSAEFLGIVGATGVFRPLYKFEEPKIGCECWPCRGWQGGWWQKVHCCKESRP